MTKRAMKCQYEPIVESELLPKSHFVILSTTHNYKNLDKCSELLLNKYPSLINFYTYTAVLLLKGFTLPSIPCAHKAQPFGTKRERNGHSDKYFDAAGGLSVEDIISYLTSRCM